MKRSAQNITSVWSTISPTTKSFPCDHTGITARPVARHIRLRLKRTMGGWTSHSDVILYLETGSRLRNGISETGKRVQAKFRERDFSGVG